MIGAIFIKFGRAPTTQSILGMGVVYGRIRG